MKALACLLFTASFSTGAVIFNQTFNVNTSVPDNSALGILDSRMLNTGIGSIDSISVTLNLTGGWNGDLYAYLAHDSGFSVLLNRIGRTNFDAFGSGSSGIDVTFDDSASNGDIHTAVFSLGQPAVGTYQPDGRTDLPFSVTADDTNRTALLSSFHGLAGDGLWELFIADVSAGDTSFLQSWSLNLSGSEISAIPEPSNLLALAGVITAGMWLRVRRSGSRRKTES